MQHRRECCAGELSFGLQSERFERVENQHHTLHTHTSADPSGESMDIFCRISQPASQASSRLVSAPIGTAPHSVDLNRQKSQTPKCEKDHPNISRSS